MMAAAAARPRAGPPVFLRDLAVLAGGQVISRFTGFLAFAALARALPPSDYGLVEYVVGLSVFFAVVIESGLGVVGVRRLAVRPAGLPAIAAQVPAARLAMALVSVPAMVLVGMPAARAAGDGALLRLFALSLLAAPWRQTWLLQATDRMAAAAFAQVLRMAVFAVLVVALVAGSGDLLRVGWAEIAAVSAMSLFCVAIQQARITPWRLRVPLAGLPGLAAEGSVIGLGNVVWSANQYAPLLLVAYFAGGDATGWFGAASRVIGAVLAFSNLDYFNFYPAMARATASDRDELASMMAASYRVLAWGGTLTGLALAVLADPICTLAFGVRFADAGPILAILAWTVPVTLLSGHARWSLVAAGHQTRVVIAQLAGSVVIAALGIALVPGIDARGAALAAVAGSVAAWLVAHAAATRAIGPLPLVGPIVRPAAMAVVVALGVRAFPLNAWFAALGLAAFAGLAPRIDWRLVPDLVRLGAVRRRAPADPGTA